MTNRTEIKRRLHNLTSNVKVLTNAPFNYVTIKGDFVTSFKLTDGTNVEVYFANNKTERYAIIRAEEKAYQF